MPDSPEPPDWIVEQPGLTVFALLSGLLALFVLLPYLQYVLFGVVVLAYILLPVQQRLEQYIRPTFAAITVVITTLLVVLIPLVYVISVAVRQSLGLVRSIRQGEIDVETVEGVLETNGYAVDLVDLYESNQGRIATAIQEATSGAIGLVGSLPSMFIGLTVTLFVLFALLRDGERLVAWFQWVLPIDNEILDELSTGLDRLMWASVVGNVAVAAIQAVMLGVGYSDRRRPRRRFPHRRDVRSDAAPARRRVRNLDSGGGLPGRDGAADRWRGDDRVRAACHLLGFVSAPRADRPDQRVQLRYRRRGDFRRPHRLRCRRAVHRPGRPRGAKLTLDCFARAHTDQPIAGAITEGEGIDAGPAEPAGEPESATESDEGGDIEPAADPNDDLRSDS